ncbi:hypothetical protein [Mesorhizobium mediterraneum]|uniref:hypothetical protein n=1 Tax=Mesorhizobium mediterraneum TaxID=43617 RepID=UPI00177CDD9F|nr:hypothetical protein [Mesorhizobium mediterraneum]
MQVSLRSKILGFCLLTSAMVLPAFADQAKCSCRNLRSVQEELKNAECEAMFFADMAAKLKAVEDPLIEAHKNPTHPDSDVSIHDRSSRARAVIMRTFKLPYNPAYGYSGPVTVGMKFGSCEQKPAELEALRAGSQCKEIADITLAHEAEHRERCARETAAVYWDRLPSQFAAEEAERYREQANAMRAQLKRIVDEGTITVEAKLEPRIKGPQFDATYSYVTPAIEMEGKSSPGSDSWTVNGKGKQSGKIKNAKIGGMTCKSSGQLNDDIDMALDTDGFVMSLKSKSTGRPGDIKLRCMGGYGMSMRPQGEVGSGEVFAAERFASEADVSQDVSTMPIAKILRQGGMSVSGKQTVTVRLVCPAE